MWQKNRNGKIMDSNSYDAAVPGEPGKEVVLFRLEKTHNVHHSNKEDTSLVIARILKHNEGDTMFFESSYYIAFEVPSGYEIDDKIASTVIRQYIQQYQESNRTYYLGRLRQYENGDYVFADKSKSIEDLVQKQVEKDIQNFEEQMLREQQKREEQTKQERYRDSLKVGSYEKEVNKIKATRKSNPWLRKVYQYQLRNGKVLRDYDGINVDTGEILRIRKADKVGAVKYSDGSKTYLYSAYLDNTMNETDVELLNGQTGVAVCFELPKRLEDIIDSQNKEGILELLKLFSSPENFLHASEEELKYIGEIRPDEKANKKEQSDIYEIKQKVSEMQKEFKRQRTNNAEGR